MCPRNITFLHKILHKGQNMLRYYKTLINVTRFKADVFFIANNQQNIIITTEKI